MPVIHEGNDAARHCVRECKLGRTCRIRFKTDTKHLRFKCNVNKLFVVSATENLVKRIHKAHTGTETVCGNILKAVGNPNVHQAGIARLACKIFGNANASNAVTDPECTNFLIGIGKRSVFCQRVRKIRGVKVQANAALLGKFHPFCKVFGFNCITVGNFAILINAVGCVQVELVLAGNKRKSLVNVLHQLLGSVRRSGIVARCLNASGQLACILKALYVITLPAVH